MHYYIDGYNLLFSCVRASENLQKYRQSLILDIETKVNTLQLDVTLVFDSQFQMDEGSRLHYKSVEIYFTDQGQTADDFIVKELKRSKEPSKHTVVTSDKPLAFRCRHEQAQTIEVDVFLSWLTKRYKNKQKQQKSTEATSHKTSLCTLTQLIKRPTPKQLPQAPHSSLSNSQSSFESCFNEYLEIFQKNTPPLLEKKTTLTKASKRVKKQKDDIEDKSEVFLESDSQRWLRIFDK